MSWSISVKTVGNSTNVNTNNDNTSTNNNSNTNTNTVDPVTTSTTTSESINHKPHQKDFTVQIEPEDVMSSLHRKIEAVTGLKSSQQRLIYRGRLISSGSSVNANSNGNGSGNSGSSTGSGDGASAGSAADVRGSSSTTESVNDDNDTNNNHQDEGMDEEREPSSNSASASTSTSASTTTTASVEESRICDVVGLSDGQTIHLVPRPCHNSTSHNQSNTNTNTNSNATNNNNNSNSESNTTSNSDGTDENGSGNTNSIPNTAGAGLLAALLGIGPSTNTTTITTNNNTSTTNNNNNNNNNDGTTDELEAALAMPRIRSTRHSSRRRFANSHRRSATDPIYPDPCPLEPIRQGLMTLHTMIGENHGGDGDGHTKMNMNTNTSANTTMASAAGHCTESNHDNDNDHHANSKYSHKESQSQPQLQPQQHLQSPLNLKRKWYIGQWLDCRDTVNQWLEATVVEITTPKEILVSANSNNNTTTSTSTNNTTSSQPKRIVEPYIDAAIGANDLEGRTKLLLEPAEDETDTTLSELNNDDNLIGFKEREYNDNLQLLKIHYNGWPHRWDEWIRSDSERIRPFRTRSRHVPSRNHVNPAPQSVFHASPSTHICSEDDEVDKLEILPELYHAIDTVQDIFNGALQMKNRNDDDDDDDVSYNTVVPLTKEQQFELSMELKELDSEKQEKVLNIVHGQNDDGKSMDVSDIVIEELEIEIQHKLFCFLNPIPATSKNMDESESMLPWKEGSNNNHRHHPHHGEENEFDHDEAEMTESKLQKINKQKLEALAPLLDRLGRVLIDFAPHVASIAESIPDRPVDVPSDNEESEDVIDGTEEASSGETPTVASSNSLVSLRPIWSSSRDVSDSTPLLSPAAQNSPPRGNETVDIDPDYVDFVNGFINNPSRPESSPRRTVRRANSDSFGSSLLSAFLASTGAGNTNEDGNEDGSRIVRLGSGGNAGGGNGTGGIDIHIHAIVTGPGGGITGPVGLEGLAGLMPPPTTTSPTNNNSGVDASAVRPTAAVDDEDDLGLFSDLYAEEGAQNANIDTEIEIEDDEEDNNADALPNLLSDDAASGITSASVDSTPLQHDTRDPNIQRPSSRNSTSSNGSRRGQMLGRIFRRALNRRSSNNNN